MTECKVVGCVGVAKIRGMCTMHYQRVLRHGDAGPPGPIERVAYGHKPPEWVCTCPPGPLQRCGPLFGWVVECARCFRPRPERLTGWPS